MLYVKNLHDREVMEIEDVIEEGVRAGGCVAASPAILDLERNIQV
jgi:hypothetical protein